MNRAVIEEVKTKTKRGITGGRKALNVGKPSRKNRTKNNAGPTGDDLGVSKKAAKGTKALAVTNSVVKPESSQQLHSQGKQECMSCAEEGFLHNHEECIKLQQKSMDGSMDFDEFLKIIGLPACTESVLSDSDESPRKDEIDPFLAYELLDEIPVPMMEVQARGGQSSPSQDSTGLPSMEYDDFPLMEYDDDHPCLELIESPKRDI